MYCRGKGEFAFVGSFERSAIVSWSCRQLFKWRILRVVSSLYLQSIQIYRGQWWSDSDLCFFVQNLHCHNLDSFFFTNRNLLKILAQFSQSDVWKLFFPFFKAWRSNVILDRLALRKAILNHHIVKRVIFIKSELSNTLNDFGRWFFRELCLNWFHNLRINRNLFNVCIDIIFSNGRAVFEKICFLDVFYSGPIKIFNED